MGIDNSLVSQVLCPGGQGDISVAVQVSAHAFSGSAKEKIEAAGGSVTQI